MMDRSAKEITWRSADLIHAGQFFGRGMSVNAGSLVTHASRELRDKLRRGTL
jgi:hypothetical protein